MSTVNLLPDDYIQRRLRYRANVLCLFLFAVVMVGVVGAWAVSERNRRHTLAVRDRVNSSYTNAVKLIEQMQQLQVQKSKMLAKAEVAASLIERVPRSYLLAQITNALPEGGSLVEFKMYPKTIRIAAPARGPRKFAQAAHKTQADEIRFVTMIEIKGWASTDVQVAQFIANLLRQPLLESVELGYSEEKLVDNVAIREFQIAMALKPDIDVIDILPPPARPAKPPTPAGAKS